MRRKTDRLVAVCTLICILCVAAVAVFSATVLDTKSTTDQIQQERADNIYRSCQDTNARYQKTVRELDRLYELRGVTPERARQLEASRKATLVVIAAIVPPRDCEALVRQQVDTG